MKDMEYKLKRIQYESYFNQDDSPCNGIENVNIIVHKKKVKNRNKYERLKSCQKTTVAFRLSRFGTHKSQNLLKKHSSMPLITKRLKLVKRRTRSSDAINRKRNRYFNSKFIVNRVSEYHFNDYFSPFNYPNQRKWRVYRCQLGPVEDSCCCSCNSDAMFEVMKSLYDCYKKKKCDNCNCILCGHLPREERRLGEVKKSLASVGLAGSTKERKEKVKKAEKAMKGKTKEEKEQILKELAKTGEPLPEGKTASEKAMIRRIRTEVGLPPEPKTASEKARMRRAEAAGVMTPLEGKTHSQKEKILKAQAQLGVPLPEGRTETEKAIIHKIKTDAGIPEGVAPEKYKKAKEAGYVTPLAGKSSEQKEKILKGLAMEGLPLPEGKTASERKLIEKVRTDLGLPPEPKTTSMREKYAEAANAGLMQPLEGKSPKEKEKILQGLADMGIPLPEGRTKSEKKLIAKVRAKAGSPGVEVAPSERIRRAKAAGVLTPLEGKTPEQKEKILKGLAMQGLPLPEAKTVSERKLVEKVRADLGLPPEPKTQTMKDKHVQAAKAGLLQPLEGKSAKEKEKILQGLRDMGIPLPEGRTASEKAIIAKVKAGPRAPMVTPPSEKLRKAKAAGLLTPLEGKTPEQKEKILRGLAMQGIPLPEGKTSSEKKLIHKVRADLGLPPEPKTASMREKYAKAADAGVLQPLEGKSAKEKEKILQGLHDMGIPLPEGRTASEKAILAKVKAGPRTPLVTPPSEKVRTAKAAGLLTPLEGKTPEQKEKILRGLAMQGIALPEGKTASEKKLIHKVRADLGLPPEPKTASMREKYAKAADAGLLQPLEGKSAKEKEKILQGLHDMDIPLPEGRTASEKAIIAKVKAGPRAPLATPPSEKLRIAKAAGLLTPLEGKTPKQKEKILRGLAMQGIPLPEGKTGSEKKLIHKVRADLGLPPEPTTASMRDKYAKAADTGVLQPLEGKSAKEKEKILQGLHDMGIPLPEGRTASEKAIIAKVKAGPRAASVLAQSEKLRKAKAAGLLTPLSDKSPAQREKILRGLAMQGVPLPEAKTASEKMLIDKVRADLGLPPEPKTISMRDRHTKAADAGFLQPLEGKSPKEKERILQGLHDTGIPLPEGRTASEKALIAKVKAGARAPSTTSEKLRKAKAAGVLTPLEGKTPAQKEKIIRGLAMQSLPLPDGKTASERKLIQKVRADLGLPPEPKTPSMKEKYAKAANAGLIQPLEGKSTKEKEKILQGLHDMGIPLPEGRTASEKALIAKVKAKPRAPSLHVPSEKMRKAQAAGLLTPLEGKTPEQKEKILRGLAMQGIPLPEGKTASERRLTDKVRADLALPPAPKTAADREKYNKAVEAGLIIPLEGKSTEEKERILRGQHELGLPLPEGRTASEKSLIRKIKSGERKKTKAVGLGQPTLPPEQRRKLDEKTAKVVKEGKGPADECICGLLTPESEKEPLTAAKKLSEKIRTAKAAGLLTPLEGKTPEQKEKILRGLVKQGLPLPEGKTASERKLIDKVTTDLGLPPEPKTPSMKERYARAQEKGIITPLEGKTASQKEKILRRQAEMGIPLPVGRTASEKALIAKIKASTAPSITTEKLRKAKAAGLLTPLEGKTPEQKEKILRGLAKSGLPLPEGKTVSEKALVKKIKADLGLPERTQSEKIRRAKTAGLLTPLEGKTKSQKEKILRGRAAAGLPLPAGKTASERALIQKIKDDTGYVTPSPSERMKRAKAAGLLTPLEGKTAAEKEKIIRERVSLGVPITEGKTPSEKEIIRKITAGEPPAVKRPSEKEKQAKAAGLLTPLEGKTPEQKEKILRGLVKAGIPLPEPKSASERDLMNKIRYEVGLPPEPKTPSLKDKYKKAQAAGIITPLEGKTPAEKEKILRKLHDAGIPLPEGRTPSEKSIVKRIKAGLPERKITSEKLKAAKAAGLLTPLEGKTSTQKEKIIKDLAKAGMPMPEPKTASEREIIRKVRTELGLPPEAATASIKEKMQRAQAAGIITPLEGKKHEEKEKILKDLAEAGVPLPEGRTATEKAIISKLKAESKAKTKITPEKLAKAKEAGLLTPLAGKSAKDKERIMRGLLEQGLPLPETQTASERKIAEKIRKEFGLPPEPKNSAERMKMRKAQAAGTITPLEGKTAEQKEKILRNWADAGIPLPEGRTASERALIKKVKAEEGKPPPQRKEGPTALPPAERAKLDKKTAKVMKEGKGPSDECICGLLTPESEREEVPTKLPSEKIKKAKAAGLITPLEGKTKAEKERILRELAKQGMPLPETKTSSERKLADKIRKELGLPPEPKNASMREKHEKAAAVGALVPLEGLSPAEKERVLKAQADLGIPLPEGRTASEKALISKVTAESKGAPAKIPSEKLRHAKSAGLLTPLKGKSKAQREKILRGLAKEGIPLPEGKTSSEKKIIQKVRKELGLPPDPTTASIREKHEKAAAAGVLAPLEGLSPAEKERVLKAQADLGIPLPEGRTASEKAIIAKVKAESKGAPAKIPSEKLRHAKSAGLLTPLEGKSKAQKEKILRGLAKEGIPLPEGKTSSEKKLIQKIRKELGLPPEPTTVTIREKHEKAAATGVLVPLEGLSPAEKERVLRAQADLGIPLPEGRTASEKALIAKVKAESKGTPTKIPSEKLRHAKSAGLLTPLEGKSKAQREKILRGLAKEGIPLPEGKTTSEKKLIHKIRKQLGLPPEPTTASMRGRHEKAAAAGVLVPLEGLSQEEKKRVLRGQANLGLPLPEGRTASEKALIAKIKAEQEPSKVPSEKLRKAKAAGLLTPLEGKTKAQKEKVIKGLAEAGLPLPEGKTASEKALIQKVRTELGIPPPAKTASEKSVVRKAKAEGLLTPLAGKSTKEKERIVKGLIDAGLPVPEGRTASEKELIRKVRTAAGLPPEKTASERKVEIRTKSKKVGVSPSKKITKSIAAKAGIAEEYEDIIKTTTCDRGCGCDKKKIRFKHSYVKIRVTSPDISSLCPCPDECVPGVKAGAFIDNEGIKVTVGRVDGVTSYTSQFSNHILESPENVVTLFDKTVTNSFSSNSSIDTVHTPFKNIVSNDRTSDVFLSNGPFNNDDKTIYDLTSSFSYTSGCNNSCASLKTYDIQSDRGYLYKSITPCEQWTDESDRYPDTSKYLQSSEDISRNPASISCSSVECSVMEESSRGSFDSILVIKSESSLSLSTKSSCSMDVISVISLSNSSCLTDSTHYLYYPVSNVHLSNSTVETSECFTNRIDYTDIDCIGIDTVTSASNNQVDGVSSGMHTRNREDGTVFSKRNQNAYLTYRLSQTNLGNMQNMNRFNTRKTNNGESIIVINNLNSDHDITTIVDQLLSNNEFSNTSSIFIVVPTSDDNDSDTSSGSLSSTICIQLSEHHPNWTNRQHTLGVSEAVATSRRDSLNTRGLKISSRGKKYFLEGMQETTSSIQKDSLLYKMSNIWRHRDDKKSKNKLCQISTPKEVVKQLPHGVSTDTTSDRPCCCAPKRVGETHHKHGSDHRCVANVVSELITPLLVNQGLNCDTLPLSKRSVNQQASFMSINREPTPVTTCRIPPCAGRTGCHHPSDMLQIPYGTPMPEPVPDLRPPILDPLQPQHCQCNPEKLRMLLEQAVMAGKTLNMKSIGCGGAVDKPQAPIPKAPIPITSISEDCATCSKPEHVDGLKMQCSCSGKRRTVKLRPLCPCERHQPPVSKTIPGPKAGTRSLGCQCCVCKDSKLGSPNRKGKRGTMGHIEITGPAGGLAVLEAGGTYTQAGMKQTPTITSLESTTPKKNCACQGKNGKKKKNVICECPPPEPEEPLPEPEPYYVPVTLSYEEYKQNHLEETRQVMRMRSDMTQTQSGFKMFKKKKPPPAPEVEFTVEDAIRYYATMNPDLIRDLVPPPQEFRESTMRDYEDCICDEKKRKKSKKDVECECPYEPPPPPPPPPPEPEPEPEPEEPFRGLKFRMGGKGSGSKGLSGVCCFEMYQETSRSTSRRSN